MLRAFEPFRAFALRVLVAYFRVLSEIRFSESAHKMQTTCMRECWYKLNILTVWKPSNRYMLMYNILFTNLAYVINKNNNITIETFQIHTKLTHTSFLYTLDSCG